ncbi:MAG: DMT family transporter [Legionellales bacterium]|nr:DMT family transporter [Legionellales bacterium]
MLLNRFKTLIPYLAALFAVSVWGGMPVLVKMALKGISVPGFIALRFGFSSLLLLPCLKSVIKKLGDLNSRDLILFILVISVMFFSQTWAMDEIPVSWYVVIFSLTPVLMAVCLRYKMQWPAIVALLVIMISLYLFMSFKEQYDVLTIPAIIALVLGMLSWVFYSVLINKLHTVYNDLQVTTLTCYIAAIVNGLIWILFFRSHLSEINLSACLIAACVGAIVPCAFFCYSFAMRHQKLFAIYSQYLEPVLGLLLAALVFKDALSLLQYCCVVFILSGVIVVTRYSMQHLDNSN